MRFSTYDALSDHRPDGRALYGSFFFLFSCVHGPLCAGFAQEAVALGSG